MRTNPGLSCSPLMQRTQDRKKLFFDTVCTLADLDWDIYHASVDIDGDWAEQHYYIRT